MVNALQRIRMGGSERAPALHFHRVIQFRHVRARKRARALLAPATIHRFEHEERPCAVHAESAPRSGSSPFGTRVKLMGIGRTPSIT